MWFGFDAMSSGFFSNHKAAFFLFKDGEIKNLYVDDQKNYSL